MKNQSLKQIFRSTFSVLLCAVMLFASMPFAIAEETEPQEKVPVQSTDLLLATISDMHYYPSVLTPHPEDASYEAFINKLLTSHVNYETLDYIIDTTFESLASEVIFNDLKYVVISGDLTLNGEKQGHEVFAQKLQKLEEDTGLQVLVINGNHDINNSKAASYSTVEVEKTTPQDFLEIYYNLGFADAYHTFVDYKSVSDAQDVETKAGMLSYSVQLDGGYRLIMLDAGHYSADVTEDGTDEQETSGGLTEELHAWLLAEIEDAKNNGETPIMNTHWNMSGINYMHENILVGFVIDEHYKLQEELADAGLHYVFSGHQHTSDIDITYSDAGEAMYSIITPTLTEFPAAYRISEFSYNSTTEEMTTTFNTYEVNGKKTLELNAAFTGETPYSVSVFKNQYAQANPVPYLMRLIENLLLPFAEQIVAMGGIIPFIESTMELNLERVFDDLLNGGITIAGVDLFTSENILSFLDDLDRQITSMLLVDAEKTCDEIIKPFVEKLVSVEISEVPCTKFITTLGFGATDRGGNVGDMLMSIFYYMYEGNEDISDDAFMQDALKNMLSGEVVRPILDTIRTEVIDNLVIDVLLANLDVRISELFVGSAANISPVFDSAYAFITSLFNNGCFDHLVEGEITFESVMRALYNVLIAFFNYEPNTSYLFLADKILEIANIPYGNSVDEVVDTLLNEYVYIDSMIEGIGYMLWKVVDGCVNDDDRDNNVTYVYSGPVDIAPTTDEMQLPSHVSVTFGSDSNTSYNISWYTKYTVSGTNIELYEAAQEPAFNGTQTVPKGVKARYNSTEVTRTFKGVDLGLIGVMEVERDVYRHVITLEQLKPGTTYYYRIGDAAKGYWSETGCLTTASGKNEEFTFLHFTDTQSISPYQYEAWGKLAAEATALYPETDFIVHTGDFVDHGNGFMQWKWGLNAAADTLLNTPIMPTAGNHEAMGEYALDNYYYLSEETTPAQFTDQGTYYSYDYNNAHFIVLNTNYTNDDGTLADTQINWLKEDVANAADADWRILQMHESIFSQGPHYSESSIEALREQLLKLMLELDIDLVLSGHDHVYMRTTFVDYNGVQGSTNTKTVQGSDGITYTATIDPKGTMFVCGGTGGVKTYAAAAEGETDEYFPADYYAYPVYAEDNFEEAMFSAITINDNVLTFAAYTYDENGKLYVCDKMAIAKNEIIYMSGDVNTNGKFEAADARVALRLSVGLDWDKTTNLEILAADFNGNGKIQADDARRILRCAVGLDLDFVEIRSIAASKVENRK